MDAVAQDAAQAFLALADGLRYSLLVSALQQLEDSLGVEPLRVILQRYHGAVAVTFCRYRLISICMQA